MSEVYNVTQVSNDPTKFLDDLSDHLNKTYAHHGTRYTPALLQEHEHFKEFLADVQPGDILEFFAWDAGFLAHAEGYKINRGGEDVKSVTICVS